MYNPLEDERVQLGVIALASISIVAFLTSIASERPPEISMPAQPLVTEASPGDQSISGSAAPVAEAPRPGDAPIASVGAVEESVAPLRAALRIETPGADEAIVKAPVNVPEVQQKKMPSARRAKVQFRKGSPQHFSSAMNRPIWQGPLPNKKGEAP